MGVQDQLRIEVRRSADRVVISLAGELDLANASDLQQALDDAESRTAAMVVLDLERLAFMDSTGLRAVLSTRERCLAQGQQFAVTRGAPQVQRLLSVTGAAEHLHTIAAADEMVA